MDADLFEALAYSAQLVHLPVCKNNARFIRALLRRFLKRLGIYLDALGGGQSLTQQVHTG